MTAQQPASVSEPLPAGKLAKSTFRPDALAGFLVFLIAMPLCLAIARASGFPPICGIWTAVIGGVICSLISNSEMTIKGPAAGLIVIVYGAVVDLGADFGSGLADPERALLGYRLTLGIAVVAAALQIVFGLLKAGRLVDFFPLTPVHGMLAAIGLIIIAKQAYEVIGATPQRGAGPLQLLLAIPSAITQLNPVIALIGVLSLVILFGMPFIKSPWAKKVPAQFVVLVVASALAFFFNFQQDHTYSFGLFGSGVGSPSVYELGPRFLVNIPNVLSNPAEAFALPDFRGVFSVTGIKYIALFSLIGSLESLLSAKAIELQDPYRRKTDFDRDLLAVGVANLAAASIGALPMISEIVRSKANIDSGAQTRKANMFHGLFLLAFVLLFPGLIHHIPLAALGAMLVYTGYRLANPRSFLMTYRLGSEQLVVFLVTIIATLATDLLIGVGLGVLTKVAFHLWNGCPIQGLFRPQIEYRPQGGDRAVLTLHQSAVFSNWLSVSRAINDAAQRHDEVVLDLSQTLLVDHTVMEKLHQLSDDIERSGKKLNIVGLDSHATLSDHPLAARKNRNKRREDVPVGSA